MVPIWLRSALPPASNAQLITLERLEQPLPRAPLGPFQLTAAWRLTSPNNGFGGYSALIRPQPGRLLAISDGGYFLDFAEPDAALGQAANAAVNQPARLGPAIAIQGLRRANRDVESATWDPASRQMWLGLEGRNAVIRQHADMKPVALRIIPEWQDWGANTGPEAMVRLRDGRFIALCECFTGWFENTAHAAFLFAGDPSAGAPGQLFIFAGAPGYRPTDVAELPDGRLLVLMRRLLWPAPARFAAKLILADPAAIRPGAVLPAIELADLSSPLPADNFEALAIESQPGGAVTAWLMSDDNEAVSQRTLLWRLDFRMSDLPPKQKAPGPAGRP